LAQSHSRLARLSGVSGVSAAAGEQYIAAGLVAIDKVFAINPNHAAGRATQGELLLRRAELATEPARRQAVAQAATAALEKALAVDSLLADRYSALLVQAQSLAVVQ
jgi:hypothetical protein